MPSRELTILTWLVLACGLGQHARAQVQVDQVCLQRCTSTGQSYGYCSSQCSYGTPIPIQPMPPRPPSGVNSAIAQGIRPFDASAALMQMQQMRIMRQQEEALRLANEQARQQMEPAQAAASLPSGPQPAAPPPANAQEIYDRWLNAVKYRRYKWPDFDAVVFANDVPITLDMVALMAESKYAADIAYFLGTQKGAAAEISRMPLPEAGRIIFEIEKKLAAEEASAR